MRIGRPTGPCEPPSDARAAAVIPPPLPATPRLINTYDQLKAAGGDRIAIIYCGRGLGLTDVPGWTVVRIKDGRELVTDAKAAWYNRKHKTFSLWSRVREGKPKALAEALAWVAEKYGKTDFARNREGDYVEREVNEKFPLPPRKRGSG